MHKNFNLEFIAPNRAPLDARLDVTKVVVNRSECDVESRSDVFRYFVMDAGV